MWPIQPMDNERTIRLGHHVLSGDSSPTGSLVRRLCVEMEPTVSVSIEVEPSPIMGALRNGSNA